MNLLLKIKRPFVWFVRFRNRCGYGVHSPFAFDFITDIIYEKRHYYAYSTLEKKNLNLKGQGKGELEPGLLKVNRLLFRMVNRFQPHCIWSIGQKSYADYYMQMAKVGANHKRFDDVKQIVAENTALPDFVYIHSSGNADYVDGVFQECMSRMSENSVMIVAGICYSSEMKAWWSRVKIDDRVGITFDLYDVGILFFDLKKIKQHYIVNF